MWENFLSWDVDWYYVAVTVVAVIGWILDRVKKGKYKNAMDDAVYVSWTAYSAIEEGNNTDAKERIAEVIEAVAVERPGVKEINDVMMAVVDEKKAASVPPIKRFWRRALRGENLAGVLGRIAAKAAIQELLKKKEGEEE